MPSKDNREENQKRGEAGLPRLRRIEKVNEVIGPAPLFADADAVASGKEEMREFLGRIEKALAEGGWPEHRRRRLYALKRKWRRRLAGKDYRFNLVGNGTVSPDTPDPYGVRETAMATVNSPIGRMIREMEEETRRLRAGATKETE